MKKATHMVAVKHGVLDKWSMGGSCGACGSRCYPVVKAALIGGVFRLAERNIPGAKYGQCLPVVASRTMNEIREGKQVQCCTGCDVRA